MSPLLFVAFAVLAVFACVLSFAAGRQAGVRVGDEAERRAGADLEAAQRLRAELLVTVGHELRTPLTVIQGLVTVLIRHWDTLSEARRLDVIDDLALNVSSLDASVLHFIDAARIERGEVALRRQEVELAPVVDEVLRKLSSVLAGYDVQVVLEASSAWCDREAVGRILELLVGNAARFSPLATRIVVRAREQADATVITVTDQGQGIAARHLPHVFEPFWRADVAETGVSRGAGLGLSIVRDLVELHDGEVNVRSSKGRGSTFEVRLPHLGDELVALPEPLAAAQARASTERRGRQAARPAS